jgi:SAM-dependent methyltransferase
MDDAVIRHNATIEERHWWFAARRTILGALVRELAPGRRLRIVDVGCGTGGNAGALAGEHDVLGLDASAEAVRLAGERFPRARFRRATELAEVRTAAAGADLVLLMDVIEHVEDDFELLSTVVAELAPGAHVLVTVPAHPELWSAHDVASHHWRRYTAERLQRVWSGLPVEERLFSHGNALLAPLIRAARALRGERPPAHGTGADLALPAAPINALLRWTFEREARRLVRALRSGRSMPYRDGVSLIAILRRGPGACTARTKPADVPADEHRPAPQVRAAG